MRYCILAYLLNLFQTLQKAAGYLENTLSSEIRLEILSDGAQMIEEISDIICDHSEYLRTPLVLEQLKELSFCWEGEGKSAAGKTAALLKKIPLTLKKDMYYQVRAVFYAELGCKWDSMESVYLFMKEDPRFDPVVVLIPVFRQTELADGSVKQEIVYQDYLTERGIPFLEYEEYHLEQDCPELAFLCQPYEGVTLKKFWPQFIAKYTRLVYLPYYLPGSIESKEIEDLTQLPVYDCAWRVVGASEKHYRFYCTYSSHHGRNMLLTGLPKLDALVSLPDRGIPRPKGWEKLSGKTVFLWNTWFNINCSSVQYFDEVFAWFAAHPDCALIWRPHPMTEAIVKVYSPAKYAVYQEYLQKAEHSPNILIDRETSYEAAFYYSDAQFSDFSSLLPQYLLMDKPLLFVKRNNFEFVEELIDSKYMDVGSDFAAIADFMERVCRGEDPKKQERAEVLARDLPLADGQAGARVCEALWSALNQECGMEEI